MMAMYQLCRAKAAKHPFYIESIDINIYTIEELCFYLWKNVSLLDESILNEKLCDWLEGELGMQRLAFHLREKLKDAESIAELVLPVFREVRYLNAAEMYAVKEMSSRSLVARLGRSGSWLRARVCSISSPRTVLE